MRAYIHMHIVTHSIYILPKFGISFYLIGMLDVYVIFQKCSHHLSFQQWGKVVDTMICLQMHVCMYVRERVSCLHGYVRISHMGTYWMTRLCLKYPSRMTTQPKWIKTVEGYNLTYARVNMFAAQPRHTSVLFCLMCVCLVCDMPWLVSIVSATGRQDSTHMGSGI